MAKHRRVWNQEKFKAYIKAGRGQGEGQAYVPWIAIQDFSSKGISSRVFSYKTNRVHHFLSRNELSFFYLLEWSENVLDIREQFPLLDIEMAIDLAESAGIRYPRDSRSGFPYILTCDFMVTTKHGSKARTIKNSLDLKNKRILEKLEIERRYWDALGIDWRIVTEHEIDFRKARNIEWLYTAAILPKCIADARYREAILEQIEITSLQEAAVWFDERYGLPAGSGLYLIKHLIWHREVALEIGMGHENSRQAVGDTYDQR